MRFFWISLLAFVLLLSLQVSGQEKLTEKSPVKQVSDANWQKHSEEIDKGHDIDDPAKMIRYWLKILDTGLKPEDTSILSELANRPSTRKWGTPDSELYLTSFAQLLLKLDEQTKKIKVLTEQLDSLKKTVAAKIQETQ